MASDDPPLPNHDSRHASGSRGSGEFEKISRIRRRLPPPSPWLVLGSGDDAALVAPPPGDQIVLSVDTLIEGVHFKSSWMAPRFLGERALVQGLSDLAAMGARPLAALVALSLPRNTPQAWLDAFLDGVLHACRAHGGDLAGGNLARNPDGISVTTTLCGSVAPGSALRRDRAEPGQEVWVTGTPGSAAAGLASLEAGDEKPWQQPLVDAFLRPVPRLCEAAFLRDSAGATAAIDLSDGVRRCAALIAEESGCRVVLETRRFRASPALRTFSEQVSRPAGSFALDGGEDFELLFTVSAGAMGRVMRRFSDRFGIPLTRVGRVETGEGLTVEDDPGDLAFEHF